MMYRIKEDIKAEHDFESKAAILPGDIVKLEFQGEIKKYKINLREFIIDNGMTDFIRLHGEFVPK